MAFNRPTLQQIIDRIESDIKSGLALTAIIRRSFLAILSKALGGASGGFTSGGACAAGGRRVSSARSTRA